MDTRAQRTMLSMLSMHTNPLLFLFLRVVLDVVASHANTHNLRANANTTSIQIGLAAQSNSN